MLYIEIVNHKATRAATAETLKKELGDDWYARVPPPMATTTRGWQCRGDWKSFSDVERIATELTEATGKLYLATDAGSHVSPRYDVVEAPAKGEKVSYCFNGDSYPCGEIVSVSKAPACRLVTAKDETGRVFKFYRRRQSGTWLYNGTWGLISGHISKTNPSF